MAIDSMKRFLCSIALCLAIAMAGCVAPHGGSDGLLDRPAITRIEARGRLLVGSTGDYRPLTWRDPATGSWEGFGVEVAERIAAELGVKAEFVQTSWPTLAADVQTNPPLFDLAIGGITVTDARRKTMDMSVGYLGNGKTILCRVGDAGRFRSLADIERKGQDDLLAFVNAVLGKMAADGTLDSLKAKHGLAGAPVAVDASDFSGL